MMLDLILNPSIFTGLLIAAAVLTPLAAFLLHRSKPALRGRALMACGAAGPLALVFWGIYSAVLASLGFASVVSVAVVLILAAAAGAGLGIWVRAGAGGKHEPG